jgi:5-methyltetrahydrofolate--homocysteine methyltransferase
MAIKDIYAGVLAFQVDKVKELTQAELEAGTDVPTILNDGLISAMDEVGEKFSEGLLFVPEMLMAAKAMKGGLEILKPHLSAEISHSKGTVVIGTVKGDLHDIGKNLVTMMIEGAGFRIIDLGVDVKIEDLIDTVKKEEVDVLGLSALLTTTMPEMQNVIEALEETGLRNQVKVIVGGAPIDQGFADKIGADGFGADAVDAVQLARDLIAEK